MGPDKNENSHFNPDQPLPGERHAFTCQGSDLEWVIYGFEPGSKSSLRKVAPEKSSPSGAVCRGDCPVKTNGTLYRFRQHPGSAIQHPVSGIKDPASLFPSPIPHHALTVLSRQTSMRARRRETRRHHTEVSMVFSVFTSAAPGFPNSYAKRWNKITATARGTATVTNAVGMPRASVVLCQVRRRNLSLW